ncbi:MAG: hypothetical protein ACT4PP_10365 [Sporichthyaceae bacterium]
MIGKLASAVFASPKRLLLVTGVGGVVALGGFSALTDDLAGGVAGASENTVVFQFQDNRITESSGLAVSARHPGIVYTHNDSDDGPILYAVNSSDGETAATLTLDGAPARDWEAMAPCSDAGQDVLWVADIGDNIEAWKTYRLLRVPEPDRLRTGKVEFSLHEMRYADGKARDAEALLCHPKTGRLYVVTKAAAADAGVYEGPERMRTDAVNIFRRIAGAPGGVTDGAFLPDGNSAVLRGYFNARIVTSAWRKVVTFTPPIQLQGESVAAVADGSALLFGSEGLGSSVWRVPLPEDVAGLPRIDGVGQDPGAATAGKGAVAAQKAKEKAATAKAKAADLARDGGERAQRVNNEGIPGIDGQMVALVAVLALGALVVVLAARRS